MVKRSPYYKASAHYTYERQKADRELIPIYEGVVNLLFDYFGMTVGDWRIMQVLSPIHVDEDLRVLDKNILHVAISRIRDFFEGTEYELVSRRKKGIRGVWAYRLQYKPEYLAQFKKDPLDDLRNYI